MGAMLVILTFAADADGILTDQAELAGAQPRSTGNSQLDARHDPERRWQSISAAAHRLYGHLHSEAEIASDPDGERAAMPDSTQTSALIATRTSTITTASIALPDAAPPCDATGVSVTALPGDRIRLTTAISCRAGQPWTIQYGTLGFARRLDHTGHGDFLLDLFQGRSEPVTVVFADGHRRAIELPTMTAAAAPTSKIAVVWQGPLMLDLHAFEYAAAPATNGHVWAAAPRSAEQAVAASATNRSQGFLTTMDDSVDDPASLKAQVYTVIHSPTQTRGTITFAVDYASRGALPRGDLCADGRLAQPVYQVFVTDPAGIVRRQETQILAAARCGELLPDQARFKTGLIPDIRLRR
jgi:hypothetical protein